MPIRCVGWWTAYPETPVVRVVMDNLNTHRPASLCSRRQRPGGFGVPLQARKLVEHGGNRVQRTVPLLLKQRLPGEEALRREVQALVKERNAAGATIHWRFNTQDARTKLAFTRFHG